MPGKVFTFLARGYYIGQKLTGHNFDEFTVVKRNVKI